MHGRERLAASVAGAGITVAPGVYDGISARLVEQQGFETGFLSGAGVSNSRLAQPDVGFLSLPEIEATTRDLDDAVDIPIWIDADTGYGNAVSVHRTVRRLAAAGAAAVMIEDQEWPKRCGHMAGKSVIGFEEAVAKVEAADAARNDYAPELLLKARTDAATTRGLDEAIDRLQAFADAGADVVFADALTAEPDIRRVADAVDGAALSVNMGFGVRSRPTTPLIPAPKLEAMGVDVVIYPRLITAAAVAGMQRALDELWTAVGTDETHEAPETVVSWAAYTDLVGKPAVDGEYHIDGIPGTGARIDSYVRDPGGAVTGRLLPTGNRTDTLRVDGDDYTVSLVDAANPNVFLRARDLGLDGRGTPRRTVRSRPSGSARSDPRRGV